MYRLRLYVVDHTPASQRAKANLQRIIGEPPLDGVTVEIVDVSSDAERAAVDKVLLTPTLIRVEPQPACRVVGDLTDIEAVMRILGLMVEPYRKEGS